MDTSHYRRQHDEISVLAVKLAEAAGKAAEPTGPRDALAVIEAFAAALTEHLTDEDLLLYPAMMVSRDRVTAELASTYFNEMGGITDVFGLYLQRWTEPTIAADPERFARETTLLLEALADRIRRENETLYPAAERLTPAAA